MSDVVGRGVIELVADARKLKAGIDDAKKSIRTLGEGQKDISKAASASIDQYIGRLQMQQRTLGKSTREVELFKLAMRGASNEQLAAANSALRLTEAYQKGVVIGDRLKSSFVAFGAIAATGLIAAAVAFDQLTKKAGDFQDMAEKTGDTAENIASLAVAAKVGGIEMETVVGAANKLTKGLTGVDDESKAAGAAIKALGLNIDAFKALKPADQMETVAKALQNFQDGAQKSAVTMALFGKSGSEILPFLNELAGSTGRQNILTSEQIRLADEYADKQAKLAGQISLYAQVIATEMLPSFNDLAGASLDLIKELTGVKDGAAGIGNSTGIQDFADNAIRSVAFIVDAFDGLIRTFELTGKVMGGIAAMALSPIQQTKTIWNEMMADKDAIINRPFLSNKVEDRIAARKLGASQPSTDTISTQLKPVLKFSGAAKKASGGGANTAAQEAKERLAADLADIKAASQETIDTFSNAEKIMEARRSAGLLNEKEYYASKLGFINLNSKAQEDELQKELDRLSREKLSGKDKIDNDRKIAETQAKLNKVRADASAQTEILSIQEVAANEKIAKSYVDAQMAADEYIQTIIERNKREIEGMGRGQKWRDENAGRNQIEDTFTTEKRKLDRDKRNGNITDADYEVYLAVAKDTYSRDLAAYSDMIDKKIAKSADWLTGATEALQNYYDESQDIAKQTEELFTNAFQGMEDALVEFTKTGKLNFKSLIDSIMADIARMVIKQNITGPLSQMLGGALGGEKSGSSGGGIFSLISGLFGGGRAIGGPVSSGGLYQVNEKGTPELLNVAGKQYLMMGNQSGTVSPKSESSGGGGQPVSIVVNVNGNNSAPDVRRAAGQGAREALSALNGAGRYR